MDTSLPPSSDEQINHDTESSRSIASTIKYIGICSLAAVMAIIISMNSIGSPK